MSTETRQIEPEPLSDLYLNAAIAGLIAGIVFGIMIQFVLERMVAIGALYTLGQPSLSIGWIAHLVHAALFAIVFALGVKWAGLSEHGESPLTGPFLGAGYGFLLWFVNIGFIWPIWLNAVGFPAQSLPVPYHFQAIQPLIGHLVWGGLLGLFYPVLRKLR